jgi:hypothetical protein
MSITQFPGASASRNVSFFEDQNQRRNIVIGLLGLLVIFVLWLVWPTDEKPFVIKEGDVLVDYVDLETAIDMAEKHGLKIIVTPLDGPAYEVTPDRARVLAEHSEVFQINPQVFAGDVFDPDDDLFVPGRNRPIALPQ